jgi:hypothetical protein
MNKLKYLTLAFAFCTLSLLNIQQAQAKKRPVPQIYMFGFSASFNDSIIYITDIQAVDSAWVEEKTNFLQNRNLYSQQLQDYLSASMHPNRVCIVIYALKREEAEKKYLKMRRLYTSKANAPYDVRYLTENEFRFKPVPNYD